jgi:hypothetical protein
MTTIALSNRRLTASPEWRAYNPLLQPKKIIHKPFYSNNFRAILPMQGIPGLAFISFPNLPGFNPIGFRTFQGLVSKVF